MIPAVPFFKALWGTCTGRDIFYALRYHSWGRVIWHLLLLCIITALITAYAEQRRGAGLFEAGKLAFTSVFGDKISVDDHRNPWSWVAPVSLPEKPREISLPNGGRFYYTALSRSVPDSLKNDSTFAYSAVLPVRVFFLHNMPAQRIMMVCAIAFVLSL